MQGLASLREDLHFYLSYMNFADYFAIIWTILLFIVLLFLSMAMLPKRPKMSFFILIFNIFCVILSFIYSFKFIDSYLRPREISLISSKALNFSEALLVEFSVANLSKKDFAICKAKLNFHKISPNFLKKQINALRPFRTHSVIIENLDKNSSQNLTKVVENFSQTDFEITTKLECFE